MNKELIPHKHAEVIKAWADGETIEYRSNPNRGWEAIYSPTFIPNMEYRVKPKETVGFLQVRHAFVSELSDYKTKYDNVKFTFNTEGKLLTAEVIKNET